MASTKEIKAHIESVKETRKITNAMYLISSTKLQRARNALELTRPYFDGIRNEIKRVFRTVSDIDSPYFYPAAGEPPLDGTYGCLVITADKGLAGAYNQNAIREAEALLRRHPDTRLFVVGEYGRHYFHQHHIPIERSFLYTAQNPSLERAREIGSLLLEQYDSGALQKIYLIYTDLESSLASEAKFFRLLPFHRSDFVSPTVEEKVTEPFEFVPSPEEALNALMPSYLSGFLYSALVDSFCSEQNARMTAMDSANQNAKELLGELSLEYNRVRQAAITQEITEVSAGARAQHRKHRKEA